MNEIYKFFLIIYFDFLIANYKFPFVLSETKKVFRLLSLFQTGSSAFIVLRLLKICALFG